MDEEIYSPIFANINDINNYFSQIFQIPRPSYNNFIDWFNNYISGNDEWVDEDENPIKLREDQRTRNNFNTIWNNIEIIFGIKKISLIQFLALMTIIIKEAGTGLDPLMEKVGYSGHPGISYAYDSIEEIGKLSYNVDGDNKTAYELFNDSDYLAVNRNKPQGKLKPESKDLIQTGDDVWSGDVYPKELYSTEVKPEINGFILEADFYKFRGRGLIQTTWRGNYLKLIERIQNYSGENSIIQQYKNKWTAQDKNFVATTSLNEDWKILFLQTELIFPLIAINEHNKSNGNYLNNILVNDGNSLEQKLKSFAKKINKGKNYIEQFEKRVLFIKSQINNSSG
jgi:hypothetical protein